jgi:hypothetical protein
MDQVRLAAPIMLGGIVALACATSLMSASTVVDSVSAIGTFPTIEQLPPEKKALQDAAAAFTNSGAPGDKSKDPGRPLVIQVDPAPATGMLGPVQAPTSGAIFSTTNAWAGWLDESTFVIVYAGAPSDDPTKGLVMIVRWTGSKGLLHPDVEPSGNIVSAPVIGGPLRIVRIDNGEVIVTNPNGREFRFDPRSSTFAR